MFLAIDAGNTRVTLGFFDNGLINNVRSFPCDKGIDFSELKIKIKSLSEGYDVEACHIASVVEELTNPLKQAISVIFNIQPSLLLPQNNGGIKLKTSKPEKCGADRVANAYAASKLYDKRPVIVVDSGSATTFDIVDTDNEFLGGVIMPGMGLQLKALAEKTSKLPELDLNNINDKLDIISDNTEDAIYAGVVVAHALAIQGLINLCEKELGEKAFIVGTGGNIRIVEKYMNERKFDVINPLLTLEGIRLLYELNN